ncbi:MAG TPA: serine/threonine-protein kinase [Gemmataceae bacterium]|jgi:serine/threonine protein kinase|nr:serine/threonine-protein kinase [Gemmataceae bacterium]
MAISDEIAAGEAHMNSYEAAVARRDFGAAIREIVEAAKIDGRRFALFPVGRYLPQRVIAADRTGVAFLCKHKLRTGPIVVKALHDENLDRGIDEVFADVEKLQVIDHPAIARIQAFGYVEPESHKRPFLVMEYFDGVSLEEYVNTHGSLTAAELIALVEPVAAALQTSHAQGVLHRNINPASLLVKCRTTPKGDAAWDVKLIDFGLATHSQPSSVDCVAPEQRSVSAITTASDVYSFARMCRFALFQTNQPSVQQWKNLPPMLADLLQRCVAPNPEDRPVDFEVIRRCLERLQAEIPAKRVAALESVLPAVSGNEPVSPPSRSRRNDEYDEYDDAPKKGGIPIWVWLVGAGGVAALIAVPLLVLIIYLNRSSSAGSADTSVAQNDKAPENQSNSSPALTPERQADRNPFQPAADPGPPKPQSKLYTISFQDVPTKLVADFVESRFKSELEYTKFPGSNEFSRDVKGAIKSSNFAATTLTFKVESGKNMRDLLRQTDLGSIVEDGDNLTVQVLKPLEPPRTVTNPLKGTKLTKAQVQTLLRNIPSSNLGMQNEALRRLADAEPTEESRTAVRSVLRPLVQKTEPDAIKALGVWGTEDDVPFLVSLGEQKAGDFGAAQPFIEAIGKLHSAQGAPFLVSQMGNAFTGGAAFDALKQIGTPAEKAVQTGLSNKEANLRARCCEFLKNYGTTASIAALKPVTLDSETNVSRAAWEAWRTIAFFGKAGTETEENPFKPSEENPFKPSDDPFRPVIGAARSVDDLKVTEVEIPAANLLPNICVAADGKSFYALDKSGELHRFGWDGKSLAKAPTNKCTVLTICSEGVLVANSGDTKLLDHDSLDLKLSGPLASPKWIAASPSQSVAVARCEPPGILCVLDLGTFTVRPPVIKDTQLATAPRAEPTLTPDGKYFFTRGGRLCRWKLENLKMVFSESGPTLGPADSGQVLVSPDSKLVALFYPDGNKPDGDLANAINPGSTAVFAVGDLKKPAFQIAHGRGAFALAFDTNGAWASTPQHSLIRFGADGKMKKEYPSFAGGAVKQLVLSADGAHGVLLTESKVYSIQLPKP